MATKAAPPGEQGNGERPLMREENTERDRRCHEHDDRTLIELARVEKVYRTGSKKKSSAGFPALSGVDLTIATGELVAITGPSGSGKTTIINLIAGTTGPRRHRDGGRRRLDQMSEEQLAVWRGRTIGIVFQFFS